MSNVLAMFQFDAFADEPFSGNPAGVCLLSGPADEAWMQRVAAEMNLSETAFVYAMDDDSFHLRWFTPMIEADLCGHATLATAHALRETGIFDGPSIQFVTLAGTLTVCRMDDRIAMDFPARRVEPCRAPVGLLEALSIEPDFVGRYKDRFLVVASVAEIVRRIEPKMHMLRDHNISTVCVTARAEAHDHDFVSRYFAPGAGVDEDPVTGSAHCMLGPFWASQLGRDRIIGYQCSRRGGIVEVVVRGDRVDLIGRAVTVMRCDLTKAAMPGELRQRDQSPTLPV